MVLNLRSQGHGSSIYSDFCVSTVFFISLDLRIFGKIKLATVVKGDLNALFSISITIPWIAQLYS